MVRKTGSHRRNGAHGKYPKMFLGTNFLTSTSSPGLLKFDLYDVFGVVLGALSRLAIICILQ